MANAAGARLRGTQKTKTAKPASRRAAASSRAGASSSANSKSDSRGLERLASGPLLITFAIVLVVVCAVVLLYPAAKDYYVNLRAEQKLSAEYDAVVARNAQIQSSIDNLNTDEGIEDEARSELGWVKTDESAVTVTNAGNTTAPTALPDQVEAGSGKAPDTWYSGVLDKVFGVA